MSKKRHLQHLAEELNSNSISEEAVHELLAIIDLYISDQVDKYSDEVKVWIKSILSKAFVGGWSIRIGIAGGIPSNILDKYYGLL